MRALSVVTLLAALVLFTFAFAAIQPLTATYTSILGNHDTTEDGATTGQYD